MNRQNYYMLLAAKMEKSKAQYQTIALQTKQKEYNNISVGRFRQQFTDAEQAQNAME